MLWLEKNKLLRQGIPCGCPFPVIEIQGVDVQNSSLDKGDCIENHKDNYFNPHHRYGNWLYIQKKITVYTDRLPRI